MPSIKVYDMAAKEVGSMELSEIFALDYNEALIHQAVVTRLCNARQGTKSTLTRSEVRGGGKKPYRQKGTGSARQGSTRAPQWIKGRGVRTQVERFLEENEHNRKKSRSFQRVIQKDCRQRIIRG